jgi:hypothetical protein
MVQSHLKYPADERNPPLLRFLQVWPKMGRLAPRRTLRKTQLNRDWETRVIYSTEEDQVVREVKRKNGKMEEKMKTLKTSVIHLQGSQKLPRVPMVKIKG